MASVSILPLTIDLQSLLVPISADHPSGDSLRYDPVFDEVRELRREDDASLPQGVWKRELKRADWPRVTRLCVETLETRTKDLQIAGWLTEAWLHLHGFSGLETGLRLISALCRDFWDDVHPQLDGEDYEFRLAPLRWLDDHLAHEIKRVPLTHPPGDEARAYSWLDWESGLHLANLAKTDRAAAAQAEADGRVTQGQFLVSQSMTPSDIWLEHATSLRKCQATLSELAESLAERCGEDAPSLSQGSGSLAKILSFVEKCLEERRDSGDPEVQEVASEPGSASSADGQERASLPSGGRIRTRAEAYMRLNEAAEFLMRTEPHSPAPYLVRRAVAWGHMSLVELLRELLEERADLDTIYKLLGIKEREP